LVEVTVIGFLSSLKAILPSFNWQVWLVASVLISIVSAILIWETTKPFHLPEVVLGLETNEEEVILEVPTPHSMLVVANKHARSLYGRDALTLAEIEKWWNRNPFVEAVLYTESGRYLGYFDVLPLTEEGANLLECGKIREREIPTEYILSPVKMRNAKTLYIAGIAVKDAGTENGKIAAAKLFYGLSAYIEYYYGVTDRRILALAATPDGERILKGIKAKIICPGEARKDKHDLYEISFSSNTFSEVKSRASKRAKPPKLVFKSIADY
jgi:hypothetical protein